MFEPAAVTYGISTVVYTAVLFIKEDSTVDPAISLTVQP